MSDIEKYIVEQRGQLDLEEPSIGHFNRFKRKIGSERGRRISFRHALQIAASIAVILASGIVIVKSSQGSKKVAMSPEKQEFTEASNYYAHQVNNKYDEISSFQFTSQQEKEMLLKELSEMDELYQELLGDLNANPGDERVMNALVQYYQLKMGVMDQIIEQLIEIKNIKTEENEKSSI
jgi:hypothetical protein